MIGTTLCFLVGAALVAIGLGALASPGWSSTKYGVVVEDGAALAYVRAAGARDLSLGVLVLSLLALHDEVALPWAIGSSVLIAIMDMCIVAWSRPAVPRSALAVHAAGAVGMLVTIAVLRAKL